MILKDRWIVDSEKTIFGDIEIEDGKIKSVYEKEGYGEMEEVIMPAFIELHAHFREPGFTYKEDIKSGSRAAAKGGYTYVTLMANTSPACDSLKTYEGIKEKAKTNNGVKINQCVSGTVGMKGESIEHLNSFRNKGIKSVSDDGVGVMNPHIMEKLLKKCSEDGWIFMSHAEDSNFEDYRDRENSMTKRDIDISIKCKSRLHMCHVSTEEAMNFIRDGKKVNPGLTCEVAPHHLYSKDEIGDYRVNPPIRENYDTEEIIRGIKDGTVDAIATDHAPHSEEDKKNGAPGISGIEFSFPLCYEKLVKSGEVSLNRLSHLLSRGPAEILNLKRGFIKKGYSGDLVVVNLKEKQKICDWNTLSRGKNTPFKEWEVEGCIMETICEGKSIYRRGEHHDNR